MSNAELVGELRIGLRDLYGALVLNEETAPEWLVRNVVRVARDHVEVMLKSMEQRPETA